MKHKKLSQSEMEHERVLNEQEIRLRSIADSEHRRQERQVSKALHGLSSVDCKISLQLKTEPKNVSFKGEEAWIEEQPRGEGNGETLPVS